MKNKCMRGKKWSKDDEQRLADNGDRYSAKEMGQLLDRTPYSVWCKMWQLKGGKRLSARPAYEPRRKRKPVQRENVAKIEFMMMVAGRRKA